LWVAGDPDETEVEVDPRAVGTHEIPLPRAELTRMGACEVVDVPELGEQRSRLPEPAW
jgi:hypothetical protein